MYKNIKNMLSYKKILSEYKTDNYTKYLILNYLYKLHKFQK